MVLRPARVDRDHRRQPPRLPHLGPLRGERRRQELRSERRRRPRPPHAGSRERRRDGVPQLVVVPFAAWSSDDPVAALKEAVREAVETTAPALARRPPTGRLADVCVEWGNRIGGPLLVVLDQFEEYFLYHRGDEGRARSHEELSVALRRREHAGQLPALDPRGRARAARPLRGPRPRPARNLLRIDHLDRAAAREAIERPLEHWNRVVARPGEEAEIEPALVEAVLDQVETGKLRVDEAGIGAAPADGERRGAGRGALPPARPERLWDEERSLGSRVLRLQTLERLGGAERIVRTHLDATMGALPRTRAGRRRPGLPLPRDAVRNEDRPPGRRSRRAQRRPARAPRAGAGRSSPARCASSGRPATARTRSTTTPSRDRSSHWRAALAGAPEAPSRTASAGAVGVRRGRLRSRGRGVPRAVRGRPRRAGRRALAGAGGEGGRRPRQRSPGEPPARPVGGRRARRRRR